jgi:hypothetical protein
MKTAVDYLEERMECGGITWEDIQQAKEMEKQQMCKFAYKCHNHYKVYGDFKIEQYYDKTFKSE